MKKLEIDLNAFLYPMPMTIIGSVVQGRVNFMAAAWVTRVNHKPPMIAVALGNNHYTNIGIHENSEFSVNIPGSDIIEATDHVGIVSGRKKDKSGMFDVFYGKLEAAPMVGECPLCMECRLAEKMELPSNTVFVGEIVGAYADESVITGRSPDATKIDPFTLTMPDNNYWKLGSRAGKAWSIGRTPEEG
jgi:flavin reductase (DIM6/NTAB) family NADH-FMN oxidoreductase RutF